MSTIEYIMSRQGDTPAVLDAKGLRFGIAVAEWNNNITERLLEGCLSVLQKADAKEIKIMRVPGAFELTNAAARLKQECKYDAVIVIGCVVRGDTPHFDYICQGVTNGITYLNTTYNDLKNDFSYTIAPVIFCVLTTENMAQAEERTGGSLGNKGEEAAETAIKMCRPSCTVIK